MKILFSDEDIVVCVKTAGYLSQAGDGKHKGMVDALAEALGGEIFPVHRLDREVGGVMVYARNKEAAAALSRQVAERKMQKIYRVHTEVSTVESRGRMEDLLYFDRRKNKSFVVRRERNGVKKAILDYRLISRTEGECLFEAELLTGRTHQIRVQFASRGMPLLGDRRYGGKASEKGIGLFSHSIAFDHPRTGERMTFTVEED